MPNGCKQSFLASRRGFGGNETSTYNDNINYKIQNFGIYLIDYIKLHKILNVIFN